MMHHLGAVGARGNADARHRKERSSPSTVIPGAMRSIELWCAIAHLRSGATHHPGMAVCKKKSTAPPLKAQQRQNPVSPRGIFPCLPRLPGRARKLLGKNDKNASGERVDHQGQSLHCRDLRTSDPARTRQIHPAAPRRGRQGRAGGRRAHQERYRWLFLCRRRPRRPLADVGLSRPRYQKASACRFHRDRRLFLFDPSGPCRRGYRGRQMLDRADSHWPASRAPA